jgi:hypothetical protein
MVDQSARFYSGREAKKWHEMGLERVVAFLQSLGYSRVERNKEANHKERKGHAKGRTMTTANMTTRSPGETLGPSIQEDVNFVIEDLLAQLPSPEDLSADQRRGIIARYTAVLEGNFIYWMTGAYLSVGSEQARSIILDNLLEEVRDSHPRMLRTFALAAHAIPKDSDAQAVHRDLTNVRLFVGRLSAVPIVTMMAFFEGFIQKFMSYLADLAEAQGSVEMEYTDVHGICDVAHTAGLFNALAAEMSVSPDESATDLFEGVDLLRALIQTIVDPVADNEWVQPIVLGCA